MSTRPVVAGPAAARPGVRPRRRLDQTAAPLIPLRPLSVTEVMDAAFLLVRRNVRLMVGVPAAITVLLALYIGVVGLLSWVAGNSHVHYASLLTLMAGVMLGELLFAFVLSWMQFVMCRSALETVFGQDVVPERLRWRDHVRLIGPALAQVGYTWVFSGVVSTVVAVLFYMAMLVGVATRNSEIAAVGMLSGESVGFLLMLWAFSYTALVAPIYVAEGPAAPAWIGRPFQPTGIFAAIGRNYSLLGFRNSFRMTLANLGGLAGFVLLSTGAVGGIFAAGAFYAQQLMLTNSRPLGYVTGGLVAFALLAVATLFSAYVAALQLVFYLDLRMRREGLDLAMRFDVVPVPEPNQVGVL